VLVVSKIVTPQKNTFNELPTNNHNLANRRNNSKTKPVQRFPRPPILPRPAHLNLPKTLLLIVITPIGKSFNCSP